MRAVPGYQNIWLGGDDTVFHEQIEQLLTKIAGTAIGAELLTKINSNHSAKRLWLGKTDDSNVTQIVAEGWEKVDNHFVKLRALIRAYGQSHNLEEAQEKKNAVAREVRRCLRRAESRGRDRDRRSVARRIATFTTIEALGATTRDNERLIERARGKRPPTDRFVEVLNDLTDPTKDWSALELREGRGRYTFGDALVRALHLDLSSGPGLTTKIMFNPALQKSCVGDRKMKKRPVDVGLFHELVHAYRNVRGRRLFDDYMACDLPDDELMATGITPYGYTSFTENKYRAVTHVKARPGYA
jgi:hypothetical protein